MTSAKSLREWLPKNPLVAIVSVLGAVWLILMVVSVVSRVVTGSWCP
ncbi:MAG: hypothetical protein WCC37_08720 [Candidatus Sulfotelmatobacter sp.]